MRLVYSIVRLVLFVVVSAFVGHGRPGDSESAIEMRTRQISSEVSTESSTGLTGSDAPYWPTPATSTDTWYSVATSLDDGTVLFEWVNATNVATTTRLSEISSWESFSSSSRRHEQDQRQQPPTRSDVSSPLFTPVVFGREVPNISEPIDIGFAFAFYGQSYERLVISSSGFVSFNTSTRDETPQALPSQVDALIAAYWTDLQVQTFPSSVAYALIGSAKDRSREFVVDFEAMVVSSGLYVHFQVRLAESDHSVTLNYRHLWRNDKVAIGVNRDESESTVFVQYGDDVGGSQFTWSKVAVRFARSVDAPATQAPTPSPPTPVVPTPVPTPAYSYLNATLLDACQVVVNIAVDGDPNDPLCGPVSRPCATFAQALGRACSDKATIEFESGVFGPNGNCGVRAPLPEQLVVLGVSVADTIVDCEFKSFGFLLDPRATADIGWLTINNTVFNESLGVGALRIDTEYAMARELVFASGIYNVPPAQQEQANSSVSSSSIYAPALNVRFASHAKFTFLTFEGVADSRADVAVPSDATTRTYAAAINVEGASDTANSVSLIDVTVSNIDGGARVFASSNAVRVSVDGTTSVHLSTFNLAANIGFTTATSPTDSALVTVTNSGDASRTNVSLTLIDVRMHNNVDSACLFVQGVELVSFDGVAITSNSYILGSINSPVAPLVRLPLATALVFGSSLTISQNDGPLLLASSDVKHARLPGFVDVFFASFVCESNSIRVVGTALDFTGLHSNTPHVSLVDSKVDRNHVYSPGAELMRLGATLSLSAGTVANVSLSTFNFTDNLLHVPSVSPLAVVQYGLRLVFPATVTFSSTFVNGNVASLWNNATNATAAWANPSVAVTGAGPGKFSLVETSITANQGLPTGGLTCAPSSTEDVTPSEAVVVVCNNCVVVHNTEPRSCALKGASCARETDNCSGFNSEGDLCQTRVIDSHSRTLEEMCAMDDSTQLVVVAIVIVGAFVLAGAAIAFAVVVQRKRKRETFEEVTF